MFLIYFRHLAWEFSAETLTILFVQVGWYYGKRCSSFFSIARMPVMVVRASKPKTSPFFVYVCDVFLWDGTKNDRFFLCFFCDTWGTCSVFRSPLLLLPLSICQQPVGLMPTFILRRLPRVASTTASSCFISSCPGNHGFHRVAEHTQGHRWPCSAQPLPPVPRDGGGSGSHRVGLMPFACSGGLYWSGDTCGRQYGGTVVVSLCPRVAWSCVLQLDNPARFPHCSTFEEGLSKCDTGSRTPPCSLVRELGVCCACLKVCLRIPGACVCQGKRF